MVLTHVDRQLVEFVAMRCTKSFNHFELCARQSIATNSSISLIYDQFNASFEFEMVLNYCLCLVKHIKKHNHIAAYVL